MSRSNVRLGGIRRAVRAVFAPASVTLSALFTPLGAQPAPAQAVPAKQYTVAAAADSVAMAGDSAAAIAMLEAAVRKNPRDAAAWHRLGLIAWKIVQPRRDGAFMRDIKDIRMNALADSALRWAAIHDPDNARYSIDLGRYIISSNLATLRASALKYFENGLEAARKSGHAYLIAEAADEVGMVFWRRYENVADRRQTLPGFPTMTMAAFDAMMSEPDKMRSLQEDLSKPYKDWMGQEDYYKASDYFAEALKAEPAHLRAQRHVYMALAERNRWEELRSASAAHVRRAQWDPWAWMANGLANHRLGNELEATVAFASAMVYLDERDRDRMTSLSRILRTEAPAKKDTAKGKDAPKVDNSRQALRARSESASYAARTPQERAHFDRMYWMLSDPLTLTPENEHQLEFLSRVTYAEIRWTSEDFGLRGADTDRGEVHIRYGPPPVVMNFPSDMGAEGAGAGGSNVVWYYTPSLFFVFRQPPSYGLASLGGDFAERARQLRTAAPVLWTNVKSLRHVDSIGVQVVRFRATGAANDSLADVMFVAELPVDSLVKGTSTRNAYLDTDFRVYGGDADIYTRDSTRTPFTMPDSGGRGGAEIAGVRSWRDRYPTGGEYAYRVEALQPQTMRGARAIDRLILPRERGYGMSDVLLAHRVLPREGDAQRWSDFVVVPSAGRFKRGQQVGLLWETYALEQQDGGSRYKVVVTLERTRREGAAGFALQVLSGAGQVVGRKASASGGKVSLSYDRQVPARPAAVDYLTLDLGAASPGRYRLTVEITDQATQKTTSKQRTLTIE